MTKICCFVCKKVVGLTAIGFLLTALTWALPIESPAQKMTSISILPQSEVSQDEVLLGDIASIHGISGHRLTTVENIVIGKAPLPGCSRVLEANTLLLKLRQNGLDLNRIKVIMPSQVSVSRKGIKISKKQIKEVVESFLAVHFANSPHRLSLEKIRVDDNVVLPEGKINYLVVPPNRTRFIGNVHIPVDVMVDGKFEKRIWVATKIAGFSKVVVARRSVKRNDIIGEDDVELIEMNVVRLPADAILEIDEAVGKRVKHSLSPGAVLRGSWVEEPPLVNKGDVVKIVAQKGNLRITTLGEAIKKGCKGDRIRVINIDTRRSLYARVLDEKTVQVDF
jgi:flagella basal body P-ring formation protein FlgA